MKLVPRTLQRVVQIIHKCIDSNVYCNEGYESVLVLKTEQQKMATALCSADRRSNDE